ncbi:helix-turn-helix domain-containing protein [Bosea thiooxidans]
MTPAEYRAAIARLGLSQVAAGKLLGVDGRTSQKWALGERAVPPPVARLLAYIEKHGTGLARSFERAANSP